VAHVGFGAIHPKDLPILLLAGDRDPVGRKGKGVRELAELLVAAGMVDVEVRLYPGARHEVINETNRDKVQADVLAFLERTIG
jgi:alpha-beta hydrolase superfamily lysophospholipase